MQVKGNRLQEVGCNLPDTLESIDLSGNQLTALHGGHILQLTIRNPRLGGRGGGVASAVRKVKAVDLISISSWQGIFLITNLWPFKDYFLLGSYLK